METAGKKPRAERDRTDASLLAERKNTDPVIAEKRDGIERDADALIGRARENADAVLTAARDRADRLEGSENHDLALERAQEDTVLREERASADDIVSEERAKAARLLAALLPLERDKTDRNLLTERVRSDDVLANRDDFLGIVVHDLRDLLSGIVLNAQVLTAAPSPEGSARSVLSIQRYAARMNRLIGDLVDIASIDAGKLGVQHAPGDAAALLGEAIDTFGPSAAEKGIALVSHIAARPLRASFDHDRMMQVLANLITNALKFTPRGGTISLHGERRDEDLHLWICDTGCGIESKLFDAVFERFWQVGANDRRGLGLGLYISRCIVEAHGGRIWVASELRKGSEFHLEIPPLTRPQAAPRGG